MNNRKTEKEVIKILREVADQFDLEYDPQDAILNRGHKRHIFRHPNGETRFVLVSTSPSDGRRCLRNIKQQARAEAKELCHV